MNRLLRLGYLSYLLIGFAHVIVGSLLTELLAHYDRHYQDGGMFVFAQFLGFMIGVLGTPWLARRLGYRRSLVAATLGLAAAEAVYGTLPPWGLLLAMAPIAGFGFGMIEAMVGSIIIDAADERKAVAMSRVEVFFGIGALGMPLISWLFMTSGWWRGTFFLLAAFALAMAAVWGKLSLGPMGSVLDRKISQPRVSSSPAHRFRARGGMLVLFFLFFLVYVGLEMSLVNFLPSMLIEGFRLDPGTASLSVSFFWLTMAIGRMYAGVLAERVTYANYLLVSCGFAFLLLIGFASFGQTWQALVVVLLLGLSLSGLFSIALVLANHLIPRATEQTTSLMIAAGGIGGGLLPLLIGWSMDHLHVDYTRWLLAGASVIMLLLVAAVMKWKTPRTSQDAAKEVSAS